jgi:hypothetical protein
MIDTLSQSSIKPSTVAEIIAAVVDRNMRLADVGSGKEPLTPYIVGDPGIAKTSVVRKVGHTMGLEVRTLITAQYDPAVLGGFPIVSADKGTVRRARAEELPWEGRGILFLDELPQASLAVQNIVAQLIQEHRIGPTVIPPTWSIIAAGNKPSNRAGTTTIPSHLRGRLMFLYMEPDIDEWLEYAVEADVAAEIVGYLRYRKDFFHKFETTADGQRNPRSWEKSSEIIALRLSPLAEQAALTGVLGVAGGGDLAGFLRLYRELPSIEEILSNPRGARLPVQPQVAYACAAALARAVDAGNIDRAITYLDRIGKNDIKTFALNDALLRNPGTVQNKAMAEWIMNYRKQRSVA